MEFYMILAMSGTAKKTIIFIAVIVLLIQYVLALFAFRSIVKSNLPLKKLLIWNFVIILLVIIGPVIAMIYSRRLPAQGQEDVSSADSGYAAAGADPLIKDK